LTGECEGKGGYLTLKELFPHKTFSFRAPGFCWSPPHLEAIRELGIKYDFSTNLSSIPIQYKRITFYPFPGSYAFVSLAKMLVRSLIKEGISNYAVFDNHPYDFVYAPWDTIYFSANPMQLYSAKSRTVEETKTFFRSLELFLKRISIISKKGLLEITPPLEMGKKKAVFTIEKVIDSYMRSIAWAKNDRKFNYSPRFLIKHFFEFFDLDYAANAPESKRIF
jgi:hypothetical protein